jgi:hypothetical protein
MASYLTDEPEPAIWLLELEFGRVMRFASRATLHDGIAYYGGLEVGEVLIEAGVRGAVTEPPGAQVSINWPLTETPVGGLRSKGSPLAGQPVTLSLLEGGRARKVLIGTVDRPRWGGPGEPLQFIIDARSYTDVASWPPEQAIVDESTWPDAHGDAEGQSYPWVLGQPGLYEISGEERRTAGSKARTVVWTDPPTAIADARCVAYNIRNAQGTDIGSFAPELGDTFAKGTTFDGVRVGAGDRVLVRYHLNGASTDPNLYTTLSIGDPIWEVGEPQDEMAVWVVVRNSSTTYKLELAPDFATSGQCTDLDGSTVRVLEGDKHGGQRFRWAFTQGGVVPDSDPPTNTNNARRFHISTSHGARRLVICGEQVEAETVYIFGDGDVASGGGTLRPGRILCRVQHGTDGQGNAVAYVDLEELQGLNPDNLPSWLPSDPNSSYDEDRSNSGMGPTLFAELMENGGTVSWATGPGVRGERGPVRTLGDALLYLAGLMDIPVDRPQMASVATRYRDIEIGMDIDRFAPVFDIIRQRLLPLMTGTLAIGGDGLRAVVIEFDGEPARTFEVGRNCSRVGMVVDRYLNRTPVAVVHARYAQSRKSGNWKRSDSWGVKPEAEYLDPAGVRGWARNRSRGTQDLQLQDIWTRRSSDAVALPRLRLYAEPVSIVNITAEEVSWHEALQLVGRRVAFLDEETFVVERMGYVSKVLVAPDSPAKPGLELVLFRT